MTDKTSENPLVNIIMGSKSDWETMQHASQTLLNFGVKHESAGSFPHHAQGDESEYLLGTRARRGSDHRCRGWSRASGGRCGRSYGSAGAGCTDAKPGAAGHGFAAFNGADAGGNPSRDAGDRQARRDQRRTFRRRDPCHVASERLRESLRHFREEQAEKILKETLP